MGREMVKLSWATKTFVHLQFYHLVPLLLQCLISLFARSLAWLFVCFLFVCFVFSSFLRFWLTGWLTDRLTYILPCWFSFFFISYLLTPSFFSEATHVLTYPPTYLSFCWSPRSIHVLAHRYSYMPSPPYYIFIHLHSHCCLSFHHIVFSSVPCFLVTLYARYLRRSTTNTPSALGCLKKKVWLILQQIHHYTAELCDSDVFGNKPVPPRVTRIHP